MPAFYKIEKVRKLVLTTGSGFLTKQEVFTLQAQMLNDPDFDPSFSQLADFAQLTNTDIGMSDLGTFAQRDAFSVSSRRAIIVTGDIAYGFAKIFELYRQLAGAHGIRVFRTSEEASDWLFAPDQGSVCSPARSSVGSTLP